MLRRLPFALVGLAASLVSAAALAVAPAAPAAGPFGLPPVARVDVNRLAAAQGLPLFWTEDANGDGVPDPAEIVPLGADGTAPAWTADGAFTPGFEQAWRTLVEARRREVVRRELDQGRPTLVLTDLRSAPEHERTFARHVLAAAGLVDDLFLRQRGALALRDGLTAADPESRAAFERNHGPWCTAPETETDPLCSALPTFPPRRWDTYPPTATQDAALCERLRAEPAEKRLLDPFTVVRDDGKGGFQAVPYHVTYEAEVRAVAAELRAAATALDGHDEAPLGAYLRAAATAFETDDWPPADEAWAALNAENSRWYLRIAPDEVYWDLCQEKAGFHVSFARIDQRSLEWQAKLLPLRTELETSLAKLIGKPYVARDVQFHLPDFVEIIVNAGDSRSPTGATIGQSLPNWGPVAQEGRGRTVAMTNLYTDPDSNRASRAQAEALLTPASLAHWTEDPLPSLVATILHEAAHNLGPTSDYRLDGRDPSAIFGGPTASTLEELKAQTAALWYVDLLRRRGVLDDATARQVYATSLTWAFGHISRGMYTPDGIPKTYSQLAAIQVAYFVEAGALRWETDPKTDGADPGRFDVDFRRLPAAVERLMQRVARIKAVGDVAGAEALIAPYVDGPKHSLAHPAEIEARYRRAPKATFVYSVLL